MKYTPRAQQVFKLASIEVESLGHPCVSSQHLLLGLLILGSGFQFSILTKLGFTVDSVRQSIRTSKPDVEQFKKIGGINIGISSQRALERAMREAAAMSESYTGTQHILLGLLAEEGGGAAALFVSQKVDTAKTRQEILTEYTLP